MKIVVLDGFTLNPGDLDWNKLSAMGELTVFDRISSNPADIIKAIGYAEIVFTNKTPLSNEILKKAPSVKYIGVLATGYNIVDIEAAKKQGITVTNVPAYSTDSVAQLTFALLLEICHHAGAHTDSVKNGQWNSSADFCYWNYDLIELSGKTFGIVGFGNIGRRVAKIADAFGMRVIAHDPAAIADTENKSVGLVSFEELLGQSDIISLHCPLNDSTKGIINKESVSKMKNGVMIINTARGPLVNEGDLRDALETGKVAAAAVDVVSAEPISVNNPLLAAKNIIITPHIAWAPKAARIRLMDTATGNLKAFLNGKPENVVSK
jgi:glycerate dehydrogenase